MNILIIKDDKPGHYNQTKGLANEIKKEYPDSEIEYIDIQIRSKLRRKLLKNLLNFFPSFFRNKNSIKYLDFFYKEYSIPLNRPDIIISTGGNTASINTWFSKLYSSNNILNGALRGLREELFTYITTVIDLGYKNQIVLDVAPSLITKDSIEIAKKEFSKKNKFDLSKTYYSLLIGGSGSGYNYSNKFYDDLIEFVKKTSNCDNIEWLITTSRRTPLEIERKLENELKEYTSYFVSYNKKEEKILLPFLGMSEKVFVTEESSSMISEAISSGKSVFTLGINESRPNNNYLKILDKFESQNLIKRVNDFNYINKVTRPNISNKINKIFIKKIRELYE